MLSGHLVETNKEQWLKCRAGKRGVAAFIPSNKECFKYGAPDTVLDKQLRGPEK